jgi:glycerol-3-phosphate dehydrogenase (NAD(P)+)
VLTARARPAGVDMPITEAVVAVLEGRLQPAQAMARLMAREAGARRRPAQPPPA